MKISILVNEVAGGWEPDDTRLGGTEESVVRWAEILHKWGHQVIVFRNGDQDRKHDGVIYVDRNRYAGGSDVTLNIKSSEVDPVEPTLYLTNETNAPDLDLSKYDGVIWPTEWAAKEYPVNNNTVIIIPHGYDSERIYPGDKVKNRFLYSSSPDRGLDSLTRIWPVIVDHHPDAQLYVTYGGQIDTPNTNCLGSVDQETMDELYQTADFWIHPCNGGELYGIAAIQAQASESIPIYFPTMALKETVKVGISCTDERDMLGKTLAIMADDRRKEELREQLREQKYPTWHTSAKMLESSMIKVWKSKSNK